MWKNGTFKEIINTPVYCVELNQFFESAIQAERETGIDNSAIQKVCKKQHNYAGIKNGQPIHWLYAKDATSEEIQKLKNKKEILKGIAIPIYCVELDRNFSSATEAGKALKIDPSSIRKVIRGKQKTAGGYHWQERPFLINNLKSNE